MQSLNDIVFSYAIKRAKFLFKRFLETHLSDPFCTRILGDMGYTDKLQKHCLLHGLAHSELAAKVGLSKSSISRILSGAQEPKLGLAHDLASKALGISLDYLVEESPEAGPDDRMVMLTEEEMTILRIVRRLGANVAIDRLLNVPAGAAGNRLDSKGPAAFGNQRGRNDS